EITKDGALSSIALRTGGPGPHSGDERRDLGRGGAAPVRRAARCRNASGGQRSRGPNDPRPPRAVAGPSQSSPPTCADWGSIREGQAAGALSLLSPSR